MWILLADWIRSPRGIAVCDASAACEYDEGEVCLPSPVKYAAELQSSRETLLAHALRRNRKGVPEPALRRRRLVDIHVVVNNAGHNTIDSSSIQAPICFPTRGREDSLCSRNKVQSPIGQTREVRRELHRRTSASSLDAYTHARK